MNARAISASIPGFLPLMLRGLAALALALTCACAHGQPGGGLSAEAQAIFTRWLASTCIVAEEGALVEAMTRYARELAPAFRRAIAAGPPPEELAAVRDAAQAQYEQRAKFPLDRYRIVGISEKDLANFRRVSREQYVTDQVRRYATGYRANAVAGLGVVGGADSRAFLARLAANRRDPLAAAAREALKTARPVPGRQSR